MKENPAKCLAYWFDTIDPWIQSRQLNAEIYWPVLCCLPSITLKSLLVTASERSSAFWHKSVYLHRLCVAPDSILYLFQKLHFMYRNSFALLCSYFFYLLLYFQLASSTTIRIMSHFLLPYNTSRGWVIRFESNRTPCLHECGLVLRMLCLLSLFAAN
jgi:hypothetical protein